MANSSKPETRVAIVGAGFISDYHIAGIRAAGGARVEAIVGRDRRRTEERARDLGIPRAETDIRAVLDDASIDAVVIATPDDMHEQMAVATLKAGKAVLLQKPMALDSAGCRAILAARDRSGSLLTVSFMHRYFPEVRWLRDLLRTGRLGPVQTIRIRNATPGADWADWFYRPGAVAGGVVMQLGVHGIDLCRHLLGPVSDVFARLATARPERLLRDGRVVRSALEDNAFAIYGFEGSGMASHEMSYTEIAGCDRFRLELQCEAGVVWLRTEKGPAALFSPEITGKKEWVVPDLPEEPFGAAHHLHWLAMVRGEAAPDDTPEAGLATIEVAEGIYRAAGEGRVVPIAVSAEGRRP